MRLVVLATATGEAIFYARYWPFIIATDTAWPKIYAPRRSNGNEIGFSFSLATVYTLVAFL